jgi:ABC-type nickel/cobalt efflux system permease component RcnA
MRRIILGSGVLAAAVVGLVLVPSTPASAHPLGNFSVNQYVGLTVRPDRLDALAVVDLAEIPTLQDRPTVDADGSGAVSDGERAAHAAERCAAVAGAVVARIDGSPLVWTVASADFAYTSGTGGLEVSRLSCTLSAPLSLPGGESLPGEASLSVENGYLAERIGWREMSAVGAGVGLVDSPLPTESVTGELRTYPTDPLAAPLDVRAATLRVSPSAGTAASTDAAAGPDGALTGGGDPVSRWMAAVDRRFQSLAGGQLTPLVVLLTIGLALLLGAGHAALPGHGKTVLAAYLAGRRGRPRDAVLVAGTVTFTHTGGVLVLGLILTVGTAVAGEQILGWLGLASGILVLAIGAGMVLAVLRGRRPGHHGHAHHGHGHAHHGHEHHRHDRHAHGHGAHDHGEHDHSGHSHIHPLANSHPHHDHDHHDHVGSVQHFTPSGPAKGRTVQQLRSRLGLAGIGIAGGLVPSPSALIVLLAAIGLGRTGYGILLVVVYGAGMALTLTGAGLLLLAVQRRLARRGADGRAGQGRLVTRVTRLASGVNRATPAATAALVLLVGAGLAARAAAGIV